MVCISKDCSGKTFEAKVISAFGYDVLVSGDGFESIEDVKGFYDSMAIALGSMVPVRYEVGE